MPRAPCLPAMSARKHGSWEPQGKMPALTYRPFTMGFLPPPLRKGRPKGNQRALEMCEGAREVGRPGWGWLAELGGLGDGTKPAISLAQSAQML